MANIQQLSSLFSDDEVLILVELPSPLDHRLDSLIHGKPMTWEVWVYPGHVCGRPCESTHVHRCQINYLILELFSQRGVELKVLPFYLPFLNLSNRSMSPLIDEFCLRNPFWFSFLFYSSGYSRNTFASSSGWTLW